MRIDAEWHTYRVESVTAMADGRLDSCSSLVLKEEKIVRLVPTAPWERGESS